MSSYSFGSFVLDVPERRLLCEGASVPLTPKVFDALVYLVERPGRLVTKDELLEALWAGAHVEEGSLPRTIHVLRKALNNAEAPTVGGRVYIETVPTKGYRFVADVTRPCEVTTLGNSARVGTAGDDVSETTRFIMWRPAQLTIGGLLLVVVAVFAGRAVADHNSRRAIQPSGAHTRSGAAYARFQSGRLRLERHLPGDVEAAVEDFEAAVRLDARFAAAYAGKADAKFFRYWDTGAHDDIVQARLAVRNAIELDDSSAYAYTVLCRLLATYDWDFAAARTACRRAVDLDPRNHEARRELAFLMASLGKRDVGLQEMDTAVALAPTSFNKRSRGLLLYFARRFDEAIAQFRQVEATDPEFAESRRWLARAFEQKGDYRQALDAFVRYRELVGAGPEEIAAVRQAFASHSWHGVLRASLAEGEPPATLESAGTLAQLGQLAASLDVLEAMVSARRVMIVHMDTEPRLDPVRSAPRFAKLAQRVGLREQRTKNSSP